MRGAVLAVKPVNDTMLLTVSFTLPGGFGYVLNEAHANIVVDVAEAFENVAQLRISQPSQALADFDYRMSLPFQATSQDGVTTGVRATRINSGFLARTPIVPVTGATASLSMTNLAAAAGAAGTIDAVISFFEYDREQLVWYPANSVQNVATR